MKKYNDIYEFAAQNPMARVCIGPSLGGKGGYVYIGDNIIDGIEMTEKCLKGTYDKALATRADKLEKLVELLSVPLNGTETQVVEKANLVKTLVISYNNANNYIKGWKPLKDRKVTVSEKTRNSTDGRVVIQFDGSESYGFWFDYECETRKVNGKPVKVYD